MFPHGFSNLSSAWIVCTAAGTGQAAARRRVVAEAADGARRGAEKIRTPPIGWRSGSFFSLALEGAAVNGLSGVCLAILFEG